MVLLLTRRGLDDKMIYRGKITAPKDAETELRKAGFEIWNISDLPDIPDVVYFTVQGPEVALDAIDHHWGEWVWSLTQVLET